MSVASMPFAPDNSSAHPRPSLIRRDTDQILSYYQSEDAGKSYYEDDYVLKLAPSTSTASAATTISTTTTTSTTDSRCSSPSSTYSDSVPSDHEPKNVSPPVLAPSIAHRRTSKGSTGGSDKRRVAIVEMDAVAVDGGSWHGAGSDHHQHDGDHLHHRSNGTSDLLSRRGRGNLAFVAPPDASPSLYAELTPPCQSAPVLPQQQRYDQQQQQHDTRLGRENSVRSSKGGHHRSQSDAIEPRRLRMRKTSRDIGIVGTSITLSPTQVKKMELTNDRHDDSADLSQPQISPVFQTPHFNNDAPRQTDPLLEKAESLMQEARASRERGRDREREREQQQQKPVNGHTSSSKRDSAISPVIVGINPDQMWQALPPASPPTVISYTPLPAIAVPVQLASPGAVPFVPPPAYLFYQPGVHASAGPLPPPPRQMNANGSAPSTSSPPRRLSPSGSMSPPPPRPPRLHTPSTSDRVSQRLSSASSTNELENDRSASSERPSQSPKVQLSSVEDHSTTGHAERQHNSSNSNHTREGAFIASTAISGSATVDLPKQSTPSRELDLSRKDSSSSATPRIRKASSELALTQTAPDHPPDNNLARNPSLPKHRSGFDLRKQISKSTLKSSSSASPIKLSKPLPDPNSPSPATPFSPPSESGHSFMSPASFEAKRFSRLPKTPSRMSFSNSSNRSNQSGGRMSPHLKGPTATRIKSPYPEAMHFGDISAMRKASERSIAYATKINELANHDAGLEDWVKAMKRQFTKSRTSEDGPLLSPTGPRGPSSSPFAVQKRHASRGSIGSEVTFPRRLDAYVATDLTPSEDDVIPEGPPPSLPYPSLAQGVRVPPSRTFGGPAAGSIASTSLHRVPSTQSTSKSSIGVGFFASIGRKSSMRREKSSASTAGPIASKLLMRRNPTLPPPTPRPVQIVATPSLPGGPRAPPNRMQRAQSVIAPARTPAPSIAPSSRLERHMSHRSSSTRSASISTSLNHATLREGSPEFEKQAKKLCDLMPNADPHILRGYLRRTGQDMVAIGQYLEDERKGCLRRD